MLFPDQDRPRRNAVLAALHGLTVREARDLLFEIGEKLFDSQMDQVLGAEYAQRIDAELLQVASGLPGLRVNTGSTGSGTASDTASGTADPPRGSVPAFALPDTLHAFPGGMAVSPHANARKPPGIPV